MAIYHGGNKIRDVYFGTQKIKEIYSGSQLVYNSIDLRGFWIHKDTNVKTYFGADADFIDNGVMSRPSWIANAKEIRLCSGITEFETITSEGFTYTDVFAIDTGTGSNFVLEKLDFGNAQIETIPMSLIGAFKVEGESIKEAAFRELVLNSYVRTIAMTAMASYLSTSDVIITIMPGVTAIGGYDPNNPGYFFAGFVDYKSYEGAVKKFTIKTPSSNIAALTNLIANAGGTGVSGIQGNYEIVAL